MKYFSRYVVLFIQVRYLLYSSRPCRLTSELPILSYRHRLYLNHTVTGLGLPTSGRLTLRTSGVLVVERSAIRGFAADCPLSFRLDV